MIEAPGNVKEEAGGGDAIRSKQLAKKPRLLDQQDKYSSEASVRPEDFVRLAPIPSKEKRVDPTADPQVVALSRIDKAAQLKISDDRMSVTGWKGYRSVRATHGVHAGTWYCEVRVASLGGTGHCRLGWSTKKAELQAPVGYDKYGYALRDVEGHKVTKAWRDDYAAGGFAEGDVIGLLLHMPPGGRPIERRDREIVRWKGTMYYVDEPEPEPEPLAGALVGFAKNGAYLGAAFENILEGTYYPTASLYTHPSQAEGATVTFNFGPTFAHAPPEVPGVPAARPMCEAAVGATAEPAELVATKELADGDQAGVVGVKPEPGAAGLGGGGGGAAAAAAEPGVAEDWRSRAPELKLAAPPAAAVAPGAMPAPAGANAAAKQP